MAQSYCNVNQLFVCFQILLREGCKKILVADSLSLLQKMHRTQTRGVRVDGVWAWHLRPWRQLRMFKLGFIQRGCFLFSEENICESCLATILPSGCAFSVYLFKSVKVVLCLKTDFNFFFVTSMFQTWPNHSVWWCFTADTCFTRSVYLLPEQWVIHSLFIHCLKKSQF